MGNEGLKQQLLLATVLHQLLVINSTLANIILPTGNISGQLCLHRKHFLMMAKISSELNKWNQSELE